MILSFLYKFYWKILKYYQNNKWKSNLEIEIFSSTLENLYLYMLYLELTIHKSSLSHHTIRFNWLIQPVFLMQMFLFLFDYSLVSLRLYLRKKIKMRILKKLRCDTLWYTAYENNVYMCTLLIQNTVYKDIGVWI